jgi:2-C-methyl-D-erythritol 2,4-cyclodiphosphate synthase
LTSNLRIGTGFDIHRLVFERKLMLAGLHVPFNMGLEGHSDGDVLIHAIIDALLGATAIGDIGLFFPSSEAKFANIDSAVLLAEVAEKVRTSGYAIVNIDTVIICERPKLSKYYPDMQANLNRILSLSAGCLSIKAKTADGIGDIGRGEAIAAQASVLVERLD